MKPTQPTKLLRLQINQWQVVAAGFSARVVHCLDRAGINTVGELRSCSDKQLLALYSFGGGSIRNVRWFFRWTDRLENGQSTIADLRKWLYEFLDDREISVLERRYGLHDPLFRPPVRRMTLQEIANQLGGVTRERARQLEEAGLVKLRSHLARALAAPLETCLVGRINKHGGTVTPKDLGDWQRDSVLGGYQPWGALALVSDTLEGIHACHGCFCCLPSETIQRIETAALRVLREARTQVAFNAIRAQITIPTRNAGAVVDRNRLLRVMLDYHPKIDGTVDARYFLPKFGIIALIVEILRAAVEPLHYREIARRYNTLVQPHSRRGTGFMLHLLRATFAIQEAGNGRYKLRGA